MRRVAVVGLLFMLATAPIATAQPATTPATPASARDAFRRGEAAYSAGNYETAIREWTNAYASDPRPRIQFALSQAYERMGDLESAIGALKRFIESGDPEDPTYSDANARLVALQQRLGATGVVVRGGAEGGAILVDGQDWGRTPRPDKIIVTPGNHVIVVHWPDNREYRTNVYVPPGQVVAIQAGEGSPAQAAAPSAPAEVASAGADPTPAHSSKRTLWYSLGSGVAAAGVGLVGYGTARFIRKGKCDETGIYCKPDAKDSAGTQGLVGVVAGSALLAGGAALFVVGAITGRKAEQDTATTCGVGWASASCTVRF